MQINAIGSMTNSVNKIQNFKGNPLPYEGEILDTDFQEVVEKAQQDVSPLTIALTSVLSIAAIVKGKDKVVPLVRNIAVKAGEGLSQAFVKIFGGLMNKVENFVKKGNVDGDKLSQRLAGTITDFANNIRKSGAEGKLENTGDSKFLSGAAKLFKDVVGKDKADKVVEFLNNNGITNWVKAFDAAIAAMVVVPFADRFSDKVENICDEAKIQQAADALGIIFDEA